MEEAFCTRSVCAVDDDTSVLQALARLLHSDGLAALTFRDEKIFLAHAATDSVRVVVLDICLPGMSGLEVRSHLLARSLQSCVILITGRADFNGQLARIKDSVDSLLTKPFDDSELLSAIRSNLAAVS